MNLHKYNTKFQPIIKSSFAVRVKNVLGGPYSGQVPLSCFFAQHVFTKTFKCSFIKSNTILLHLNFFYSNNKSLKIW